MFYSVSDFFIIINAEITRQGQSKKKKEVWADEYFVFYRNITRPIWVPPSLLCYMPLYWKYNAMCKRYSAFHLHWETEH